MQHCARRPSPHNRTAQLPRAKVEARMPREANAVDFWRGFALVSIFINHIPGIYFERFTHRNYSISDSAELFVFLAGWSLGLLVGGKHAGGPAPLAFRLGGRSLQIYAAH